MAFGISELLLPALILLAIAFFGKGLLLKLYRDFRGIKADMKEIDIELATQKR